MSDRAYQLNILNTYREAEVRGAELLQRLLRGCDDPNMTSHLTWQLADEARHIQLLTDLLCEFGGSPTVVHKRALPLRDGNNSATAALETLAYLHATEERLQQRYREHAARCGEDARLVSTLQTLASDEEWHLAGVEALLLKQEKKFGRTRVTAAINHYWNLSRRQ